MRERVPSGNIMIEVPSRSVARQGSSITSSLLTQRNGTKSLNRTRMSTRERWLATITYVTPGRMWCLPVIRTRHTGFSQV